jgi:hypothetical protein
MVEFGAIGQDEARRLYREYSDAFAGLAAGSPGDQGAACRGTAEVGERIFRVEVNGRSYMVGVTEV